MAEKPNEVLRRHIVDDIPAFFSRMEMPVNHPRSTDTGLIVRRGCEFGQCPLVCIRPIRYLKEFAQRFTTVVVSIVVSIYDPLVVPESAQHYVMDWESSKETLQFEFPLAGNISYHDASLYLGLIEQTYSAATLEELLGSKNMYATKALRRYDPFSDLKVIPVFSVQVTIHSMRYDFVVWHHLLLNTLNVHYPNWMGSASGLIPGKLPQFARGLTIRLKALQRIYVLSPEDARKDIAQCFLLAASELEKEQAEDRKMLATIVRQREEHSKDDPTAAVQKTGCTDAPGTGQDKGDDEGFGEDETPDLILIDNQSGAEDKTEMLSDECDALSAAANENPPALNVKKPGKDDASPNGPQAPLIKQGPHEQPERDAAPPGYFEMTDLTTSESSASSTRSDDDTEKVPRSKKAYMLRQKQRVDFATMAGIRKHSL